jgi:YaiO family outer membrane protein
MRKIMVLLFLLIVNTGVAFADEKLDVNRTQAQIRAMKKMNNLKGAEELAKKYLVQYPHDVDVQLLLASIFYQEKDYDSAKAILTSAKADYPNDPDVDALLASVNLILKNQDVLLAYIDKIDADMKDKNYTDATDVLDLALNKYPENQDLLKRKALLKEAKDQQEVKLKAAQPAQGTTPATAPTTTTGTTEPARSATVFSPANLQATNILNAVVTDYATEKYGHNQIGINQQSLYGTSPDSYWDFSSLYYTRSMDFGMVLGSLNYASRFGFKGWQGAAEAVIKFTKEFYVDVNLAYATNLNLFPNWTAGVEGYIVLPAAIQISFGDLYRAIDPKYFNTYTTSIEKDIGDYALIFRPYMYIPQRGINSVLYTGTVRRYFNDSMDQFFAVTVGYGQAPDLADLQSIDFIVIKDRSLALTYQFPIVDHRMILDFGLSYENQRFPSGFIRQLSGADLNFRVRF